MIDRDLRLDDSPEHHGAHKPDPVARFQNVGIVVSPPISRVALNHVQFVRLVDNRILVILVSRSGIVQNRVIHSSEEITQTELDQAARYIVEHFKDRTLFEIRSQILKMIQQEQALYDKFMQRIITLSTQAFSDSENELGAEVYLDGASNLIKTPEFSDINRMKLLFETIEQKSRLAALISRCIEGDDRRSG